jgi:protein involved in polysaccharide export with SLBB domain
MRKILFFIIVVIILVSLTWFRQSHAQTADPVLGKRSKAELIKAYQENGGFTRDLKINQGNQQDLNSPLNPHQYASPDIYDSSTILPEILPKSQSSTYPPNSTSIPFDSLKPFGQDLFNTPRETTPPGDIATASDYLLGPGDNLVMRLLGRSENEYNLTIDREGKVYIPRVGEIVAWGVTVDAFKLKAEQKLSSVYTDFQLTVSLGKIRSIRIYLTGEVRRPGAYTVSSLTSLFNALYLAGGPTANGSMRDIRLMRSGKPVASVDLYRFLLEGDNTSDVRLETGDAIFVPVCGPRVAIRGEIGRPAIYEILSGQAAADLLALAGNATAEAHLDRVMLERIAGRDQWQVIDLNLNSDHPESISKNQLADGDRVTVYSVFDARKNTVGIFGKVKHPGYYQRQELTRVADLVSRGQLQDFDVHLDRANLFRRHSDWRTEIVPINLRTVLAGDSTANISLSDRDSLVIYSIQDLKWSKAVSVAGEVQHPETYPLYDNMTVADLIFLAGSYTHSATTVAGELARFDSAGNVTITPVNLAAGDGTDVLLRDNDQLFVRRIPEWQLHRTVTVEGEVAFPGEYVLADREETLFGLLGRVGGFTQSAFPGGIVLQRPSIGNTINRMQIGAVLDKSNPIVKDSLGNISRSKVFELDTTAVTRIALDVDDMLKSKGGSFNVTLKPGDRIYVPSVPTGISVLGAVGANGTIMYKQNKSVKYYVDHAGSFAAEADKKGTRLIKANGMVFAGGGTLGRKVEMGDVIVVPTRIKTEKDWGRTLTNITGAAAGILGSILVITKL